MAKVMEEAHIHIFEPTRELRWLRFEDGRMKLQQAWRDNITQKIEWRYIRIAKATKEEEKKG